MPRREKELDRTSGPVAEFAYRLRETRRRAGITYRELAARTDYSHAHLVRAARGDQLPSWLVAKAYLEGCGITSPRVLKLWDQLWVAASQADAAVKDPDRGTSGALQHITTPLGFGEHLHSMAERHRDGPFTLRALAERTDIPKSCLAEWFNGQRLPSVGRLYQFAGALDATQQVQSELRQVRDRLAREQGDRSTTAQLLTVLREQADGADSAAGDRTWRLALAVFQAGEQRLHNDRVLSTWTAGGRPIGHSPTGGRHRADSAAELDRARAMAERLVRELSQVQRQAHEAPDHTELEETRKMAERILLRQK